MSMSMSSNMLRTRRKDNNVKPNRRLDRKSSRGMIFENEDLRLKTININAEVERGHSDIKKLKRENDQLRREIWYLRDEYEKLDKLLRRKETSSSGTCSSDSESCSSCSGEVEAVETSQNLQNVQKTNMKRLNQEFDHLSIVQEENSTENSEKASLPDVIKPDQSYPAQPTHFFAPISNQDNDQLLGLEADKYYDNVFVPTPLPSIAKSNTDVIVKTDSQGFSNGGNLEELLNDIETISHDILKMSNSNPALKHTSLPSDMSENSNEILTNIRNANGAFVPNTQVDNYFNFIKKKSKPENEKTFKSELNVALMPTPMGLIGVEKYRNIKKSWENISKSYDNISTYFNPLPPKEANSKTDLLSPNYVMCGISTPFVPIPPNCPDPQTSQDPFFFGQIPSPNVDNGDLYNARYNPESFNPTTEAKEEKSTNLIETAPSLEQIPPGENEENLKFQISSAQKDDTVVASPKLNVRRKVSIQFKGQKEKTVKEEENNGTICDNKTSSGSEGKSNKKTDGKEHRKSVSVSPERKHGKKNHKKHKKEKCRSRGNSFFVDRSHRERSFSVCTDRSNILDHRFGMAYSMYDDTNSDRTNSLSSCETVKGRKLSVSQINSSGKIPWCGCWGNGCL